LPLPGRRLRGLDVTLTREGGGACRRIDRPARRLTRGRHRSRTKTGQYPASSRPACRQTKGKWAVHALARSPVNTSEGLALAVRRTVRARTRPGCAPIGDKASAEPRILILLSACPQRRLSRAGLPDCACCPVASSIMGGPPAVAHTRNPGPTSAPLSLRRGTQRSDRDHFLAGYRHPRSRAGA